MTDNSHFVCPPIIPTTEAATHAVGGEPVAYRWRQPGNKHWIYDPTPEWIEDHKHEIELEPLFAAQPATPLRGRESLLVKAAQDFIDKVDRGEARSKNSYAAFKAALASPPEQPASPDKETT